MCGEASNKLRSLPDKSVDSIVTDPPYGLTQVNTEDIRLCLLSWLHGAPFKGTGRGGLFRLDWDSWVPGPEFWQEALRVLKPGGFCLVHSSSRMASLMELGLRLAGFQVLDPIYWLCASNQPKNAVEIGPGQRRSLKPAAEPILLLQRPLEGTVVENYRAWGTGGFNVDACRIPSERPVSKRNFVPMDPDNPWYRPCFETDLEAIQERKRKAIEASRELGRYPSNVILEDDPNVLLELDTGLDGAYLTSSPREFFYLAKARGEDERGAGNNHPTAKPLSLTRYLVKLITPENGVVLDPFLGSGTTGVASVLEKRRFIGIEKELEWFELSKRRIQEVLINEEVSSQ